jgi:class 3 adenylate cyclase
VTLEVIANTAGDSVLAEFGSAVDAVQCAVEAQAALAGANADLSLDRHINFRISIHVGDVMVKGGDLFGDGVNIAARLQTLASSGGTCISGRAHDQVRKILPFAFADLGAHANSADCKPQQLQLFPISDHQANNQTSPLIMHARALQFCRSRRLSFWFRSLPDNKQDNTPTSS